MIEEYREAASHIPWTSLGVGLVLPMLGSIAAVFWVGGAAVMWLGEQLSATDSAAIAYLAYFIGILIASVLYQCLGWVGKRSDYWVSHFERADVFMNTIHYPLRGNNEQ